MASPRPGASILMTSAPSRRRRWVAYGPAMMWLKSATRMPSSGCIWFPRTVHGPRLFNTLGDPSRIEKHGGTVNTETRQGTGIAGGVVLIELVEAPLLFRRYRDELHALVAPFGLARLNGGRRLLRQGSFPNRDRRLEHGLILRQQRLPSPLADGARRIPAARHFELREVLRHFAEMQGLERVGGRDDTVE